MSSLTNTKIKDTYPALLKADDNGIIGASEKVITDGLGNASVLSIGTASASFSSDIEVNTLTIGLGSGSIATNTALGLDALFSNTSGSGNVSVGQGSMRSNTSGSTNIAVGKDALRLNTTGGINVAIGYTSLYSNTIGQNNTAVGNSSSYSNTTGLYNTALGSSALYANETSGNNTALGYYALRNNTAANNTAVGSGALADNTTGAFNSALGKDALNANTTGTYNIGIGTDALNSNVDGDRNVALGYAAGDSKTSGDDNIYIGQQADGASATTSNEIVIGSGTTGNGSNTATYGNASITEHHFTAGQVNVSGDLAVDTDTLFVDSVNHRVGIGLTDPPDLLSLQAIGGDNFISINADTASPSTLGLRLSASINTAINGAEVSYDVGNELFQIKTGNQSFTNRLTIDRDSGKVDVLNDFAVDTNTLYVDAASNEVGINTSSPNDALEVAGDTASAHRIRINNANASGAETLIFTQGSTIKSWIEYNNSTSNLDIWQYTANDIRFGTNNGEKMRIDSSGNVGIGESNPENDNRLHIKYSEVNVTPLSNSPLVVERNDVCLIQTLTSNASDAGILFGDGDDNDVGGLFYLHGSDAMTFRTATSERMRIDSSGNVGIGTSTMGYSSGNRGLIQLYGTDSTILGFSNSASGNLGYLFADSNDVTLYAEGSKNVTIGMASTGNVRFLTNNTERMRITSGGEVQTQGTIQNPNFGVPLIETTAQLAIGSGGTYTLGAFSGVVIVNNRSQGSTEIFVLGGGGTASLGNSAGSTGTWSFSNPNYIFTNNLGSTQVYSFMLLKTRPAV